MIIYQKRLIPTEKFIKKGKVPRYLFSDKVYIMKHFGELKFKYLKAEPIKNINISRF